VIKSEWIHWLDSECVKQHEPCGHSQRATLD
jgi:hypothetical protein